MDYLVEIKEQAKKAQMKNFYKQLDEFLVDHDKIQRDHEKKYMDIQKEMDEFKVMIGFINHYNDKIKVR